MKLSHKIILAKVSLVVVPVALVTGVALWRSRTALNTLLAGASEALAANTEVSKQALLETGFADLAHQAETVRAMCAAAHETLTQQLHSNLRVAREVLDRTGSVSLDANQQEWKAVNQFTGATTNVSMPVLRIGDHLVTPNADAQTPSPVVDRVQTLVGGTCTVFERMNTAGDMLRVATNVKNTDGQRAIGTYIPAQEADGTANAVIATVLKGETYVGRAFVVDCWYVAAYEPVKDAAGEVIGMLYVGVPQESAASLRQAIMNIKVGETGYVYVLNATGRTRGHYVISQGGQRDGENILDVKDADGNPVIVTVCDTALKLKEGEVGDVRYKWKNANDTVAREKIVKLTYFKPWDWVIGVGAYTDEFYGAVNRMEEQAQAAIAAGQATTAAAARELMTWSGGLALAAVCVAVFVAALVTRGIARPIERIVNQMNEGAAQVGAAAEQVASASQELAAGAGEQASSIEETSAALEQMAAMTRTSADNAGKADELAKQAREKAAHGAQTMTELNAAMGAINESSGRISKIIKVIEEIAFQTNLLALNAAVEAARAGEHGKGFAVVAEEVRNLAQRCAGAARDTTGLIEDSVERTKQGTVVADSASHSLQAIVTGVTEVADLLSGITRAANEQAQGVEQINTAVAQMDKVTQQNAAGAEESAAAAEELGAQAATMRQIVQDLARVVRGGRRDQADTGSGGTRAEAVAGSKRSAAAGKATTVAGASDRRRVANKVAAQTTVEAQTDSTEF